MYYPIMSQRCSMGGRSGDRCSHGKTLILTSAKRSINLPEVWGQAYFVGKLGLPNAEKMEEYGVPAPRSHLAFRKRIGIHY